MSLEDFSKKDIEQQGSKEIGEYGLISEESRGKLIENKDFSIIDKTIEELQFAKGKFISDWYELVISTDDFFSWFVNSSYYRIKIDSVISSILRKTVDNVSKLQLEYLNNAVECLRNRDKDSLINVILNMKSIEGDRDITVDGYNHNSCDKVESNVTENLNDESEENMFKSMRKYKNVEFSVTGNINNEREKIIYKYENGKGSVSGDSMCMFMLRNAMERKQPTGPVGQYLDRDINNPLAMLFILTSNEIFESDQKLELISGELPQAAGAPKGAII